MQRSSQTLRALAFAGLLAAFGLAGCSSTPEGSETSSKGRTGTLVVRAWSTVSQGPVSATGTLTSLDLGTETPIDTRQRPEGQTLAGLAPGPYRIKIVRRYGPEGAAQNVDGFEDVYLEPGARREATVVVTDRAGELGLRPIHQSSPAVPSPPLPLAAARRGGTG